MNPPALRKRAIDISPTWAGTVIKDFLQLHDHRTRIRAGNRRIDRKESDRPAGHFRNHSAMTRWKNSWRATEFLAARLLDTFIKSTGEKLIGDDLLTQVWDNPGLKGGSNNLSQSVSILRRALEPQGCTGLIFAVPGSGFRLEMNIKVLPVQTAEKIIAAWQR